jgi:hypothetical protein
MLTGPSPRTLRCVELVPNHAVYRFGAYAFHCPERMTRGLWFALLEAWPQTSGRFPDLYSASYAAQAVDRHGASLDAVAEAFAIERDSARKKVVAGRSVRTTTGSSWRVACVIGDAAAALLGVSEISDSATPDHPESDSVQLRALTPDWAQDAEQQREALQRASRAIDSARAGEHGG